ncbi:TetR/AcrR family transcriptional regulator [Cryobacterium sp. GrIS_2_6]|uniref:TetR/AcrR family transcriptional regulator n=1 Tax=Cryobacterium sp. GrIS_2_6 TaxID=3162785 RepID=UPI002E021CC9|nr:AcrR family transcriptional regulator [Cryobacterium psychrotolerans]
MTTDVNAPRKYRSTKRAMQAKTTRLQLLSAAWTLFTERGYVATTVAQIAHAAGTSVDTLYEAVGRKPVLLRQVVESAISGSDETIPAERRDYVQRIRETPDAATKFQIYAAAIAAMSPRTAPIFLALRDAARTDPDCAALHEEISTRRATNMLLFAADLRLTGALRPDLSDEVIGDIVWATAGAEHYTQLVDSRGWSAERFGDYLYEMWSRLFLASPGTHLDQGRVPGPP